jgi:hypothetical protein
MLLLPDCVPLMCQLLLLYFSTRQRASTVLTLCHYLYQIESKYSAIASTRRRASTVPISCYYSSKAVSINCANTLSLPLPGCLRVSTVSLLCQYCAIMSTMLRASTVHDNTLGYYFYQATCLYCVNILLLLLPYCVPVLYKLSAIISA